MCKCMIVYVYMIMGGLLEVMDKTRYETPHNICFDSKSWGDRMRMLSYYAPDCYNMLLQHPYLLSIEGFGS